MEKMSSSVQSWVEEHKLTSIGAMWATALGASAAHSWRRAPQRATGMRLVHARIHAQALTVAVLGGAALMHYYNAKAAREKEESSFDFDFYSQLPAATGDDGQENERWSY